MIIKSKHASNYTVIPNDIFKTDLSLEAVGLLTYFLSLPADWAIKKTTLHVQLNSGRDKIDRIFKELQTNGYVNSVKVIGKDGMYDYDHIVYDKPYNGEPLTGIPSTENPSTVNTLPLIKKDIQSTNLLNTNILSKEEKKKQEKQKKENDFINLIKANSEGRDKKELQKFIDYWTEDSKTGKMRFEGEKYFDEKKRINTWFLNADKFKEKKGFAQKKESINGMEYKPQLPGNLF